MHSECSESIAASSLQDIFQRLITWPNLGRFSWAQEMVYSCFRGLLLPNFKPFLLLLVEYKHFRKKSSPGYNTEAEFSLKLSEMLGTVRQYLRQELSMENINLNYKSPTTLQNQIKTYVIMGNAKVVGCWYQGTNAQGISSFTDIKLKDTRWNWNWQLCTI